MGIEKAYRDKKKFMSQHVLYILIWMQFGIKNTPGKFQLAIDVILSTEKRQDPLLYLEEIVEFLKQPQCPCLISL